MDGLALSKDKERLRHVQIHSTQSTVIPWEADIMVENDTPTAEDYDFELKRRAL